MDPAAERKAIEDEEFAATERFLRLLRESGVRHYEGPTPLYALVKLDLTRPEDAAAPAIEPPKPALVDAGGGVMVDPDLLGHEVA